MHVAHGNWLPEEAKLHQERDELERVLESHAVKGWSRFCGRHSWIVEGMQPHFMENSHTQLSVVLQVCTCMVWLKSYRAPMLTG